MSYIRAEKLTKQYGTGDAAVMAVGGMSFDIRMGEFVVVMGESGSGKSTLLTMMGALNSPTAGNYRVDGLEVYELGQDQRADFRREFLGFIFQSFHLIPYLTRPRKRYASPGHGENEQAEEAGLGRRCLVTGRAQWKVSPVAGTDIWRGARARGHCPRNCERAAHPLCRRTRREISIPRPPEW